MIEFVKNSNLQKFIIATESGIIHRLLREEPNKTYYTLKPELICPDMKITTLQDLHDALLHEKHKITIPEDLIEKAAIPIKKMLEIK